MTKVRTVISVCRWLPCRPVCSYWPGAKPLSVHKGYSILCFNFLHKWHESVAFRFQGLRVSHNAAVSEMGKVRIAPKKKLEFLRIGLLTKFPQRVEKLLVEFVFQFLDWDLQQICGSVLKEKKTLLNSNLHRNWNVPMTWFSSVIKVTWIVMNDKIVHFRGFYFLKSIHVIINRPVKEKNCVGKNSKKKSIPLLLHNYYNVSLVLMIITRINNYI